MNAAGGVPGPGGGGEGGSGGGGGGEGGEGGGGGVPAAAAAASGGGAAAGGGDSSPPSKRPKVDSSPAVTRVLKDAPEVQKMRQSWEMVFPGKPVTDEQIREAMKRADFYKKTLGYADEVAGQNWAHENLDNLTRVPRVRTKLEAAGVAAGWVCSGKGHETRVFNSIRDALGDEDAAVKSLVKAQQERDVKEQRDAAEKQVAMSRRQERRPAAAAQKWISTGQRFDLTSDAGDQLQVPQPALPQPAAAAAAAAAPQATGKRAAPGSAQAENAAKKQARKKAAAVKPEAQPAQPEEPAQPAPKCRGAARAAPRKQQAAAAAAAKAAAGGQDVVTWVARRGDWRARGSCTACGTESGTDPLLTVPHPLLQVDVCVECLHSYHQTDFSLSGESTEEQYCSWCADGGVRIAICDNEGCPKVFCHSCINRNIGDNTINADSQDGWACLVCEPERLHGLQGERSTRPMPTNRSDTATADRTRRLLPPTTLPPPALRLAHCPLPKGKAAKPPSVLAATAEANGASAQVAASLVSDTIIEATTFGDCTACGAKGYEVRPHPYLCRDPASAPTALLCVSCPQKSGGGCEQAYRKAVEDGKFLPDGSGCEVTCTWCAGVADPDILRDSLEAARSSANSSGNSGRASPTDPAPPRSRSSRGHRKPPIYSKLKGELLVCAQCPAAFCASCVELNCGLPALETMADGEWACFVCEPEKLPACPEHAPAGAEGGGSSAGSHADVYCFSQQWPPAARNMHLREPGHVGLVAASPHKLGRRGSQQIRRQPSIVEQQAQQQRSFDDAEFQRGDVCIATSADGCDYPSRVLDVRLAKNGGCGGGGGGGSGDDDAASRQQHKYEYRVQYAGWKEQHDEWAVVSEEGGGGESKITLAPKSIEKRPTAGEQIAEIEGAAKRFITAVQDYTQ